MKIYKVEDVHKAETISTELFKKIIVEHYDGLPLARGIAFEQDSVRRFWGETSSGVYCARVLDTDMEDFSVMENLRQEFLKLRNVFESGVDFFIFFNLV